VVVTDLKVGRYKRREGKADPSPENARVRDDMFGRKQLAVTGFGVVVQGSEQFVGTDDLAIACAWIMVSRSMSPTCTGNGDTVDLQVRPRARS